VSVLAILSAFATAGLVLYVLVQVGTGWPSR
jgi:hypothetical protein